jgi:hypothetical protein
MFIDHEKLISFLTQNETLCDSSCNKIENAVKEQISLKYLQDKTSQKSFKSLAVFKKTYFVSVHKFGNNTTSLSILAFKRCL